MNGSPISLRDPTTIQAVSFVLFLAALPLIALGTLEGLDPAWWLGLALIAIAGLLPPASRFIGVDEEDGVDDDESSEDDGGRGDEGADDGQPPDGPVGPPTAAPGRDPGRARVEEQLRHADDPQHDDASEGDDR